MTCIHFHNPLINILSHLEQQQQTKKVTSGNAADFQHKRKNVSPLRTKALTPSLVLGVGSSLAPNSGNLPVLLQTTAGLLFVYWISNFVVPEIVLKDLQSDKTNDDQETKEDDLKNE